MVSITEFSSGNIYRCELCGVNSAIVIEDYGGQTDSDVETNKTRMYCSSCGKYYIVSQMVSKEYYVSEVDEDYTDDGEWI